MERRRAARARSIASATLSSLRELRKPDFLAVQIVGAPGLSRAVKRATMAYLASKALMELRVHMCQTSAGSAGVRYAASPRATGASHMLLRRRCARAAAHAPPPRAATAG